MEKAISWLEENAKWPKALLIYESLVDAAGNSHAPGEGIRVVPAAVGRLNAERCLGVLWVPGHCGLMLNELANEHPQGPN